jgi:hypothetical protein
LSNRSSSCSHPPHPTPTPAGYRHSPPTLLPLSRPKPHHLGDNLARIFRTLGSPAVVPSGAESRRPARACVPPMAWLASSARALQASTCSMDPAALALRPSPARPSPPFPLKGWIKPLRRPKRSSIDRPAPAWWGCEVRCTSIAAYQSHPASMLLKCRLLHAELSIHHGARSGA